MCCSRNDVDEVRLASVTTPDPGVEAEGGAEGVAPVDRLPSNVDMVDRQPGPLEAAAFVDVDRDIGGGML
jgi:hypothetical protein